MADSDYEGCPITHKCTSELNITLNDVTDTTFLLLTSIPTISKANRQPTASTPINESEVKATTAGVKTLVYLDSEVKAATAGAKTLVFRLKFMDDNTDTPRLYCNNKGAIAITRRIGKRKGSKHIDTKHFIGLINQGKLSLHHVDTDDNVSDAMTDNTKGITISNGHRHVIERRCRGTEGHWYRESEHARRVTNLISFSILSILSLT